MLTPSDARVRLKEIEACVGDGEQAHGREDELYQAVLEAVAIHSPDSAELALIALRTKKLGYARWCA